MTGAVPVDAVASLAVLSNLAVLLRVGDFLGVTLEGRVEELGRAELGLHEAVHDALGDAVADRPQVPHDLGLFFATFELEPSDGGRDLVVKHGAEDRVLARRRVVGNDGPVVLHDVVDEVRVDLLRPGALVRRVD